MGGMKVSLAVKMGLFLHNVASVTPTASTTDRSLLLCEGVNNQSYMCESGHCCGESQCCSYYYELWWFWLVWVIIFMLSCCCVCHHRRTKHRLQQQQRQHEINLIAYREAHNFPSVPFYFRFLPSYLLPDYEEVVNRPPTPPPPYSALHTAAPSAVSQPHLEQQDGRCPDIQPATAPADSDGLCNRPSVEEPQPTAFDLMPNVDNKPAQTTQDSGMLLLSEGISRERLNLEDKTSDCKDALLKDPSDDKERLPNGRRRRFTGDSGIEVCVCGSRGNNGCSGAGGLEGKELRELESLLGREGYEEEEAGDFCDSCVHRSSFSAEEEPALGGSERRAAPGSPQPAHQTGSASLHPPICLLLHTINEQEGPHHSTSTEPQG